MYAFGAVTVTGYILVLISLWRLRFADPYSPRPYQAPLNVTLKRRGENIKVPILAGIGLAGAAFIWCLVVWTHAIGRIAGPAWLLVGYAIYFWHRKRAGLPLLRSVRRDWEEEQVRVLREAGEEELLARYVAALRERNARRGAKHASAPKP